MGRNIESLYNFRVMEAIRINEKISYIPATENPLSADVGIVEGDDAVYFFDVGSNENVANYIEDYDVGLNSKSEKKKKIAVISHFHADHTENLARVKFDKIFIGKQTLKHLKNEQKSQNLNFFHIVSEKIEIDDGIKLTISGIPSSHSKGSLYLHVGDYAFLGDSTFYGYKGEKKFYNVQLLNQEISVLKEINASFFLLSHRRNFTKQKKAVITLLEQIYKTKKPNATEIEIF